MRVWPDTELLPAQGAVAGEEQIRIHPVGNHLYPFRIGTHLDRKLPQIVGDGNHSRGTANGPPHPEPSQAKLPMPQLASAGGNDKPLTKHPSSQRGGHAVGMHKMSVQQIESAFPIQSVKRPQQPEEQTERIHKAAMRRVNPTRIKDYGSAIGSLPRNSLRSQPTVTDRKSTRLNSSHLVI